MNKKASDYEITNQSKKINCQSEINEFIWYVLLLKFSKLLYIVIAEF